jgi:DNA-binding transcriptional LysR family regulator
MENYEAIKRFLRVAELGSFTQAAATLGLPKASVSLSIQQLENKLGTQLLHRTTRKVKLTPDGEIFYERGVDLVAEMDELEGLFQTNDATISGLIRVDMSSAMARDIIIPRLPDFFRQYPNIHLDLSSTDHRVDLVTEGFDCVVRTGVLTDSGLIARPLGQLTQINFASPSYLSQFGEPTNLKDLNDHWLIHYKASVSAKFDAFEYWDGQICTKIPMRSKISVNNIDAYRATCIAGLGITQAPVFDKQALLAEGQLVQIMPNFRAPPMPISLLYPHRKNLSKRMKIFMDWLANLIG